MLKAKMRIKNLSELVFLEKKNCSWHKGISMKPAQGWGVLSVLRNIINMTKEKN
jgi:hypothetical protein